VWSAAARATTILAALLSIRAARLDGAPMYVLIGNLSANKTPAH